jgi:hypothetical protein
MSYSPYAPPRHDPHHPPAGYGYQFVYSPLGWKTTGIVVGVAATVIAQFAVTAMVWVVGGSVGDGNIGAAGALVLGSLLLQGVTMFTGITFLVWMHHAAKNIRSFGHQGLEFTPGWAVGWWFIPIASLWKPFQALREIWRGSDPDGVGTGNAGSWMASPVPSLFGLWWAMYLLAGFAGMFAALPGILAGGGAASSATPAISMVSHLLNAVAGVAIILIVRQLAQRQEASHAKMQAMQHAGGGQGGGYGGAGGYGGGYGPPGYPPYGATGS